MYPSAQTRHRKGWQTYSRGDRVLEILDFLVSALGGVFLLSILKRSSPGVLSPQRILGLNWKISAGDSVLRNHSHPAI